ncbi:MAG: helix-turn-helix transcriptional regulator, partial [Moorella sp. (in: Bacteria)]|nr:helix-turn-helix transcriptional regulator [Moorella sp. (in: firmicutes)]
CELVEVLGIAQPTVSQHLRRLKTEGLAEEKKEGQRIRYRLAKEALAGYTQKLNGFFLTPIKDIPQMQAEWQRYQAAVAGGEVLRCCLPAKE